MRSKILLIFLHYIEVFQKYNHTYYKCYAHYDTACLIAVVRSGASLRNSIVPQRSVIVRFINICICRNRQDIVPSAFRAAVILKGVSVSRESAVWTLDLAEFDSAVRADFVFFVDLAVAFAAYICK